MPKLLVPYDGSENSDKAVDKALDMADAEDEIIVLYVVPAALMAEFAIMDPEVSRAKAHELVNGAIGRIRARGGKVMGLVKEGNVADTIIEFAREVDARMIIMGSVGMSKIGRFTLGSVAEKVTRHADRPVMVVR